MKRILSITLLLMFAFCNFAIARTKYDSSNHLIKSGTIRGQRNVQQQTQFQGAAAAKIEYGATSHRGLKSNYKYSNASKTKSNLKSNYRK